MSKWQLESLIQSCCCQVVCVSLCVCVSVFVLIHNLCLCVCVSDEKTCNSWVCGFSPFFWLFAEVIIFLRWVYRFPKNHCVLIPSLLMQKALSAAVRRCGTSSQWRILLCRIIDALTTHLLCLKPAAARNLFLTQIPAIYIFSFQMFLLERLQWWQSVCTTNPLELAQTWILLSEFGLFGHEPLSFRVPLTRRRHLHLGCTVPPSGSTNGVQVPPVPFARIPLWLSCSRSGG